MTITLNYAIVHARDKAASVKFLTEILGFAPPKTLSHFTVVHVGETSLDFLETDEKIRMPVEPAAEFALQDFAGQSPATGVAASPETIPAGNCTLEKSHASLLLRVLYSKNKSPCFTNTRYRRGDNGRLRLNKPSSLSVCNKSAVGTRPAVAR